MTLFITALGLGKFPVGQIVATPGVLQSCSRPRLTTVLARHVQGDWGNVCSKDAALNDQALIDGERLLSSYPIDPAKLHAGVNRLWIITERDRSVTTFLLPEEY